MRAIAAVLVLALTWTTPALATGGFECTIADRNVKMSMEGTFSHGVGERVHTFRAAIEVLSAPMPEDLRTIELGREDLTQTWLYGREIKVRLFHEHEGAGLPRGTVELVIETRQTPRDEMVYAGTYVLTVFHLAV